MFCPKCGTSLPDDANVCSQCGTPLNEQGSDNLAAAAAAGLSTGEKKKSKAPLIIGLVAAILVIVALIAFAGMSGSSVEPIVGNWTSSSYYDGEAHSIQAIGKDGCLLDVEKDGDFTFRIGSDAPETGSWRALSSDDGDISYSFQTDNGALLIAGMVDDPDLGCEMTLLVGDYLVMFNRK